MRAFFLLLFLPAMTMGLGPLCDAVASDAAADGEPTFTPEELKATGEMFGRCAGVWSVFAALDDAAEKPASAEQWRGVESGALVASAWAFSIRYQLLNPVKPPLQIGRFNGRAESLRDRSVTSLLAQLENNQHQDVKSAFEGCAEAREAQQAILDTIRDSADRK